MVPLLRIENLSHRFDYPLFEDVSFALYPGESMAVTGRSGSGKSTLLHIASGFLSPKSGEVEVLGRRIDTLSTTQREAMRRFELGVVFQNHYLFKGMSGRDNIEAARLLAGTTLDGWLLERLEIAEVIDQKVSELSGGQQQRVSIARVLAKRPRIVFADEPTGNLDEETASLVMDVLLEYVQKESAALMMVTHDKQLAARCDRCYELVEQMLQAVS